jgi:hypothetical protein
MAFYREELARRQIEHSNTVEITLGIHGNLIGGDAITFKE